MSFDDEKPFPDDQEPLEDEKPEDPPYGDMRGNFNFRKENMDTGAFYASLRSILTVMQTRITRLETLMNTQRQLSSEIRTSQRLLHKHMVELSERVSNAEKSVTGFKKHLAEIEQLLHKHLNEDIFHG